MGRWDEKPRYDEKQQGQIKVIIGCLLGIGALTFIGTMAWFSNQISGVNFP